MSFGREIFKVTFFSREGRVIEVFFRLPKNSAMRKGGGGGLAWPEGDLDRRVGLRGGEGGTG